MGITRKFLDCGRPALVAAADYLLERCVRGTAADMSGAVVVVPGRRAGRRLLELLVAEAKRRQQMLVPPRIETVGRVPEELYIPKRPFADDLVQQLAWAHVLEQTPAARLRPLLPQGPPPGERGRWRELGELLRRQHLELAADGLDFRHVLSEVETMAGPAERERWETLAMLQDQYHQFLDGLELWDRQTARLKAIEFSECHTERDIVLLGTADMSMTLRRMLDQVAGRVTALIYAPEAWKDRFDRHGCLVPAAWREQRLPLEDSHLEVAAGPGEQAEAVCRWLHELDGRYSVDEITIGVADEQLVPDLQRRLSAAGVPSRWGPGGSLEQAGPVRLLAAAADFLAEQRFTDFARLVRHVDVYDWLVRRLPPGDWLSQLDRYQSDHLPWRVPDKWLGQSEQIAGARRAAELVRQWLQPLSGGELPLGEWVGPLLQVLLEVYGDHQLDGRDETQRATLRCLQAVQQTLDQFAGLPQMLMPSLSAAEAIRWLTSAVARQEVPAETQDAVEMLGWLELPLDDAPALIVTSVNEGYLPQSVNTDLFLPNALRARLGLLDNERRLARDAYALHTLILSRQQLRLVVGRRNHDGDPLIPSRLLFASDAETAARRAVRFFAPQEAPPTRVATAGSATTGLQVPRPEPLEAAPLALSVTSLRDYLACPYRFYLRHVLKLKRLDDHANELDGGAFGSLAHAVLESFGRSSARDSTEVDEIRQVLEEELNRYVGGFYGRDVMPAVRVQVEQLRLRLIAFAQCQAAWAAQGWRISHIESRQRQEVQFLVDGQPITLYGRIDRMDVHRDSQARIVLDYKTSDSGLPPAKTHRAGDRWVDLQLPLYRHLAATLPGQGPLQLGYVLLPKDGSRAQVAVAEWSPEELEQADEVAREIVRRIRNQEFWPPASPPPSFSDDFAAICQDRVLGAER